MATNALGHACYSTRFPSTLHSSLHDYPFLFHSSSFYPILSTISSFAFPKKFFFIDFLNETCSIYKMSVVCGGDYSTSREWRPMPILVGKASPTVGSSVSYIPGDTRGRYIPSGKSPKKRIRTKTPSPPPSPTCNPTRIDHDLVNTMIVPQSEWLINMKSPQPSYSHHTEALKAMEIPSFLRDLDANKILTLQENHEGTLFMGNISSHDIGIWTSRYPEVLEADDVKYEYNFLNDRFIIKCATTPTHDALQIYFEQEVLHSMAERFGRAEVRKMIVVTSGTSMEN